MVFIVIIILVSFQRHATVCLATMHLTSKQLRNMLYKVWKQGSMNLITINILHITHFSNLNFKICANSVG